MNNNTVRQALIEQRTNRLNVLASMDPDIKAIDRVLSMIGSETTTDSMVRTDLVSDTTTNGGKSETFAKSFRRAIEAMQGDFTSQDLHKILKKELAEFNENSFYAQLFKCKGQEIVVVQPKCGRKAAIYRKKVV
ncbi:MAG: hypothetical protein KKG09_05460 [Verrucomicrobia bacterium]|nr:hypothetical protein [Verrucomicrobiota bacterium]MBU4291391.1 hypothetical protein [Verrucomicrobiota bacterium]MBU4497434.1 hypothetical protein [Verrucomicrobiota bacterium]MCG2680089.1 hypothetical protein [Kiritimatiellia bacterium]